MKSLAIVMTVLVISGSASAKPKYGPDAAVLSQNHAYFKMAKAPDFWAMMPFYAAQETGGSCSVASVQMVINAARFQKPLTSDDELATHKALLTKVKPDMWSKAVGEGGHGVELDQLGPIVEEAFKAYGMQAKAEVVHLDAKDPKAAKKLHETLVANEKSDQDFMIINFIQGVYTGDAEAGHIAPIAAYDAKTKKVLVMDPDRQWYEPYWVKEEVLFKGMATADKTSGKNRGFVYVKIIR